MHTESIRATKMGESFADFSESTYRCNERRSFLKQNNLFHHHHHHYHHLSLNREGRWGTTDNFATSFLHFCLFSTALWDLPNSRPVHSLMLSSHLFLCLPGLLSPFTVPCRWFWPDLLNGKHDHTTTVCVSLQS